MYVYLTTYVITSYGPASVGATKVVMLGIFLGLGLHITASFKDLRGMFSHLSENCDK